ncbi:YcjF family protein [Cognatishimia sp. F0-27]|uniref:YcjF family protein n=1 Tax=Cognatishimia sp. F0-27 TaxID=2816855 RepID=UPI001D0C6805|nr:DUF697 domain-containing protein [Cognatishimia sp. F0-27]MCC1493264.1 DUF697 domain-containing protein [Cognatishimia sp. F0-27]
MATAKTSKTDADTTTESDDSTQAIEVNPMEVRAIIDRHVIAASGVGLVPIPLVDLAGVAAVQLNMIKRLAELYDIDYSQRRARSIIAALIGGSVPAAGALPLFSLAQSIPVIGWTVGAGAASILSGASTYAVGHVMSGHFAKGGDIEDFSAENAKESFGEFYSRGKEQVSRMTRRGSKTSSAADEAAASPAS